MTPAEREPFVLSTPDPLQWDCFRFGIIQGADHFTFFSIVDHLHCDPTIISGLFTEERSTHDRALVRGAALAALPPPASHDDFCLREKRHLSALSVEYVKDTKMAQPHDASNTPRPVLSPPSHERQDDHNMSMTAFIRTQRP